MAIETNIGRELADLITWLQASTTSGPTVDTIAQRLGLVSESPLMIQLIGAVAGRLVEAERLAEALAAADEIDRDMLDDVHEAIIQLAKVLSPRGLVRNWATTAAEVRSEDAKAFRWFGAAVGKYQKLYRLDEAETTEALALLDELSAQVEASDSTPIWERRSITAGIASLRLALRYLPWFGHDYAERAGLVTAERINRALQHVTDDDPARPGLEKGRKILMVLIAVLGAFAAPDAAATALQHYSEFFSGDNPWAKVHDKAEPKLLGHHPPDQESGSR